MRASAAIEAEDSTETVGHVDAPDRIETVASVPRRKLEWRRAWNALRAAIADSSQTDKAFEIVEALAGGSFERSFQRFRAHPDGQRLLRDRPSLLAALSDRAAHAKLPSGSFGRAYLAFMESGNLTPDGLVEADKMAEARRPEPIPVDPQREFLGDRMRDMHDLWHVLTGYGMDEAGEAANLAFSLGQLPNLGIGLLVLAGAVIGPKDITFAWQRYLFRAWGRGHRAKLLSVVPYEELLPKPLDEVRALLGIEPPEIAHPGGIMVGNREEPKADDQSEASQRVWNMKASST